jgi:hypothetical protein
VILSHTLFPFLSLYFSISLSLSLSLSLLSLSLPDAGVVASEFDRYGDDAAASRVRAG